MDLIPFLLKLLVPLLGVIPVIFNLCNDHLFEMGQLEQHTVFQSWLHHVGFPHSPGEAWGPGVQRMKLFPSSTVVRALGDPYPDHVTEIGAVGRGKKKTGDLMLSNSSKVAIGGKRCNRLKLGGDGCFGLPLDRIGTSSGLGCKGLRPPKCKKKKP